ncbi:hypothetical protein ACFFPJ_10530, partial [Microbacterium terregens]
PAPSPTAPVFASEDEAFAAAEETYRAYVDALNQRRGNAASSRDPQTFLTGQALEIDIQTQQQLDQAGLSLVGPSVVASVDPIAAELVNGSVRLEVCLDSSATQVVDARGTDVTPADRELVSLLTVDFISTSPGLLIESSIAKAEAGC